MRPRFLAIACRDDGAMSDAMRARARGMLGIEHATGGTRLFVAPATPSLLLPEDGGCILGTLFDRSSSSPIEHASLAFARAIGSTGGGHLLRSCWGSYAALWSDSRGHMFVLRDPSAALPIFYGRSGTLGFATSDIAIPIALGLIRPEIDWAMVAHGLEFAQMPARQTHLHGLRELLPGERLDLGPEAGDPILLWKPWEAFDAPPAMGEPHSRVSSVIDQCVGAWARTVDSIQLELSGGLDSSIVAAALSKTPATVRAVTVATPQADGDERVFARVVAEAMDIALDEILATPSDADPLATLPRWTPRPRGMRILAGLDQLFAGHAKRLGVDAIFSGGGGDNVFAFTASTAPVLDAWRAQGSGKARAVARDVATLTGATVPDVWRHVARRLIRPPRRRQWIPDRSLLARQVRCRPQRHPWLDVPRHSPDGLRAHIAAILRIHDVLDAYDRFATHRVIFPLLSQPVLETCLSIPSWLWVAGGRDRAVARAAYADRLPPAIIGRGGKGRLESLIIPAFEKARPAMRERLCDGHLMAAGLLDRKAVLAAFATPLTDRNIAHARMLQLIDAELWVACAIERGQASLFDR
jgi:asparagine synthase (glutamine-hydrolysing)